MRAVGRAFDGAHQHHGRQGKADNNAKFCDPMDDAGVSHRRPPQAPNFKGFLTSCSLRVPAVCALASCPSPSLVPVSGPLGLRCRAAMRSRGRRCLAVGVVENGCCSKATQRSTKKLPLSYKKDKKMPARLGPDGHKGQLVADAINKSLFFS